MIDYTLGDETQRAILPVLKITEELILRAIKREDGVDGEAEMIAMPDLGFSNNAVRMHGGFYTGLFLNWNSIVPFVPVDATINSCGVSVFLLNNKLSVKDFEARLAVAKKKIGEMSYNWNFERGNHFISLCKLNSGKYCVVIHASADEYKKSIIDRSLYPFPGVWYFDQIKTIVHPTEKGRYLRYLTGDTAAKFISIATDLEHINHQRMQDIMELIFGKLISHEMIYTPHYGMPTSNSIAIGCSWKDQRSVLLTVPGKDMYIINRIDEKSNSMWLTPHGFGSFTPHPQISYSEKSFMINNIQVTSDDNVNSINGKCIRCCNASDQILKNHTNRILLKCHAIVGNTIHPIASMCKDGFIDYSI